MIKKKNPKILITGLVVLLSAMTAVLGSCTGEAEIKIPKIRVLLTQAEGMTITGENPILVEFGGDAVFPVSLDENYKLTFLSAGALYEDGNIILHGAEYPETIRTETEPKQKYVYEFIHKTEHGTAESSLPSGMYYEGTEITLKAEPEEGKHFLGFSRNNTLEQGGILLSYDTEYTFEIDSGLTVYANFTDREVRTITYHANEGAVTATRDESLCVVDYDAFHLCPNTLANMGQFTREGYQLIGYNTEPDGSGTYFGTGWNIPMTESSIDLYVQWAKETPIEDFEIAKKNKYGMSIRRYLGDDDIVVIPAEADGIPVMDIAGGAFSDKNLDTLIMGPNLKTIQKNAFTDCRNLHTVYLTDCAVSIPDNAFSDVKTIKQLYINAGKNPTFSYGLMGSGSVKAERMLLSKGKKKIFLISGSSSLYGMDYDTFVDGLDGEYELINFGNHADSPSAFFMYMAASFVEPGDLVITAPEPLYNQWGENTCNILLWQIFEGAYEVFSSFDISKVNNVFSSFTAFNKNNAGTSTYAFHVDCYSNKGQYDLPRPNADSSHVTFVNGPLDFSISYLTDAHVKAYNDAAAMIRAAGGEVLMSHSPANENGFAVTSLREGYRDAFVSEMLRLYDCIYISDLDDYIFSGRYFYDTDLHMSSEGALLRTKQLVKDLRAYLGKE